jgi:hypothetical protein
MSNALFACEKCGYSQALDPVYVGSVFSCPTCGNVVTVTPGLPEPAAQPVAPAPLAEQGGGAGAMPAQDSSWPQVQNVVATAAAAPAMAAAPGAGSVISGAGAVPSMVAMPEMPAASARKTAGSKPLFGYTLVFLLVYLLFMVPLAFSPNLGEIPLQKLGLLIGGPMMNSFLLFVGSQMALVLVGLLRGLAIGKVWYVFMPILAVGASFAPGLELLPFIAVIAHGISLVIGIGLGLFR